MDLTSTARAQISRLRQGNITSLELLEAYRQRYEKINPSINAVVATDFSTARELARDFDRRRSLGEDIGPLNGLPMTVKDSFDVDHLPAVCGDPALKSRQRKTPDAEIVRRLKNAGAIIWGKTNTPLQAADIQTYNKVYGRTNNPHDLEHTPGGSSGGAAAALAACLTPLEIGSDIGGSLRIPSSNCGTFTIKPSWGLIPTTGHVPPPPGYKGPEADLNVVGPMARNLDDLNLLFSIVAPDNEATRNTKHETEHIKPDAIRIARLEEANFLTGSEVRKTIDNFLAGASLPGATIPNVNLPCDGRLLFDTYQRLLIPIITAGMPAKIRKATRILRPFAKPFARAGEMTLAKSIFSVSQSKEEIRAARETRNQMKAAMGNLFEDFDVLVAPVASVPAIPHNTGGNLFTRRITIDKTRKRYSTLFEWISIATACHLPAVVVPFGQSRQGLPIGIQLLGPEGSDTRLLAIAAKLEQSNQPPATQHQDWLAQ